ncbi:4-hydroxyphenylpyruvate dioxygenase [Prauserella marina]|uniref:3-dehydroshikimate dehydratase n=1 Tax=Prauserella marina TaxID=530584 RepID=A0A222VZS6_9PSEU|nr:sugar phosphate isomerase/epimerase and 4-hydroxyphenylpyruvate domain-containing protein [Prauserella marina]ASR39429.1 4-hydroxyphenylpyruvate dioxygenase [Prauserella marina]PWV80423.1 4-hydroxyphenylpyruvate dioxygenase [Prauserella marina]SDD53978.1 4-hydroxyphenylpyruvate dioxygenase [Prauserella marina]
MHRAIATVCLSGTLEDKLNAAAAAGFNGVEIFENDFIAAPWSAERVRRHCAGLGLSIDLYQPFRDFEGAEPDSMRRNLRRAERKFELMERLGVDTILVCSSVAPDTVDDDDLAAEQLHTLAEHAARRGMRIAYEALAWGRFVNTWEHSWDIVRRGDHPALGLCVDSFHVLSRADNGNGKTDPAGIATVPGEKLFFLQLADAPRLDMDVLQWSRHHRLFPGQGSFDLATFTTAVLATGYRGPLSLEVFNDVFRQSAPDRAAVDAMRSLIALEEALGRQPEVRQRERIELARPAPAPELSGFAFTELAVDADSGPRLARALAAMGFAHIGEHRSKPVQLWQLGDARILLNSGGEQATAVSAIAVETADPAASARRAEALLAPALPRARGPAEADLTAVAAPDGTEIFFCRTGAEGTGWLSDFILTGTASDAPTAVTHIDHVALAQPFDYFDEATLFYRAVLGLDPRHDSEFAAPFGLVRGRAVTEPAGRVRIALHGTVLRRGDWAPGVPDPQHLAMATGDIFASARAMRARGAPLLSIPDNYYDDLGARLELDPEVLAAMRECQVLYDRDGVGEYYHFHTEVFGDRIFLEIVQRAGGYSGYGAVNAPVRMTAHRAVRSPTGEASRRLPSEGQAP